MGKLGAWKNRTWPLIVIAISFNDKNFMSYPLDQEEPYRLEHNRLITWGDKDKDWKSLAWAFSLRLLSLDSSQSLLDRIIMPAIMLIKDEPIITALPDDLPGLIIYPDIGVLSNTALHANNS
jgi:hypothetical protein